MRIVLLGLLFIIALLAGLAARALSIAYTWIWFVAPIFNFAPLTFPQAVGISLFTGVLLFPWLAPLRSTDAAEGAGGAGFGALLCEALTRSTVAPLSILAIGWVWHAVSISTGF
jgi:hypothetical protein